MIFSSFTKAYLFINCFERHAVLNFKLHSTLVSEGRGCLIEKWHLWIRLQMQFWLHEEHRGASFDRRPFRWTYAQSPQLFQFFI